jgi:hypothetical protein
VDKKNIKKISGNFVDQSWLPNNDDDYWYLIEFKCLFYSLIE